MSALSVETTVGEVVSERPGLSGVFENLGIDFCCGGKNTLAEACREKGLDPETVLKVLEASSGPADTGAAVNCSDMTMTELADHIEQTHHTFMKEELPRLDEIVRKVSQVHGESHPNFRELESVFDALQAELSQHLMKEEQILFPFVRRLEKSDSLPSFHCGTIANPISVMEFEHDNAGKALARIAELTNNYTPADGACSTCHVMIDGLRRLEADLHQHIHKENNILFPRAKEAEAELAARV